MVQDRLSGVELLALYGDDDSRMGAFLPGLKKAGKKALKYYPGTYVYKGGKKVLKKIHGEDERIGAFLPGLKKVGKVTKGFTSAAASAFVPKATLDLIAKLDPTKGKKSVKAGAASVVKAVIPAQKTAVSVPKTALKIDTKKALIIGGSAVGALIVLKLLLAVPKRS